MENIDLKALFNSPEPDTTEQQKPSRRVYTIVVYSS